MEKYMGEFLGTLVLIVFGTGVGASVNLNKALAKGFAPSWFTVVFAWGLAVTLGIYTAGFYDTGGHLNPAVTLAFAVGGMFPWNQVAGYILAQFLGAFCGAAIISLVFYPHFKETKTEEGNSVGIFATGPAIKNPVYNLLSEIAATFFFIFVLLMMTHGEITPGLTPLLVGFLIMAVGLSLGSTTGFALNPARDLGPRLAYALLPIPNKGSVNWDYAWIPILGPIIGAIIAVLAVNAM
ncbi:MIP/aquaporin family protein [Streptococcus panodentis]|uniref:Aquaporin n=1 Tax=Streptococcus panodentis TaxID=1581472 RepID=A0ABS5AXL6_9STRE|nr:MIP/aquaporin family protein [Streptococcus panodentis]MBP2621310.1 aquaporin [Streptococcus panodentis]